MTWPPDESNGLLDERSTLLIPYLDRRQQLRGVRRILGAESFHPDQLELLARGGAAQPWTVLRSMLVKMRAEHGPLVRLEREEARPEPAAGTVPSAPARAPRRSTPRMPWPGDAAAQAQTLREASRHGTPFCAICEASRRERERAGGAA